MKPETYEALNKALLKWLQKDEEENEGNVHDDISVKPKIEDVRNAIGVLEKFILFSDFGDNIMNSLNNVVKIVDREEINVKRQSLLTDYFEKKKD